MPWNGPSFAAHNHGITAPQAAHGARIANAVLKSGVPEGESIAIANKYFQRHDDGGDVGIGANPTQTGIGGIAPSNQTMNPMVQGMVQRYSALPPEKLQELSVMMGGTPQGQIIQRVLQQKRSQPQQAQQTQQVQQPAVPVSQRRGGATPRRDVGGNLSLGQADPSWSRTDLTQASGGGGATGYLHGPTSGRADAILTNAPAGSYVIPADVVAGLGEGNSLAGARVMQGILQSGPRGTPMPQGRRENTIPRPPAPYRPGSAKGGGVHDGQEGELTPVALSHGEFVVPAEHVARWGDGDEKKGHKIFDEFVVRMRKHIIEKLKKLPGPVKGSG